MSSETEEGSLKNNSKGLLPRLRFPEFVNSPAWKKHYFSELFRIGNGRDYKHLDPGDVPVYGSGGYMLSVNDYLHNGESVCIGRKGTIDKPVFLSGKFWTVDTLFYTYQFQGCLPKFIYYVFLQINWMEHNEAGGVPSLTKITIGSITSYIPFLGEQQKIADCLSSLDDLITLESRKLDTLKQHKKGLMQQLFPAEGETVPRLRFPEFRGAGEWNMVPLHKLGEIITGNTPSTSNCTFYGGRIPFVSPADISDKRFVKKTKITLSEFGYSEARPVKAGSVLFVCIGSTIGKVAQNLHDCATNQQINSIVPNNSNDSGFIYYCADFNSEKISSFSGRQAIPIINKTSFSSIEVKIPAKLEQKKIAHCLSSLDDLIAAQVQKVESLKTHKKGLMQQLFPILDDAVA